ncbi:MULTISPECIES: hypothetical protein [unclassified Variovorax]|uniref:hypothetical protein n=1 Tax=unclassified Variovorax TaxID=663243 RepID=UPI0008396CBB|nr:MULTISPECIES: hypothetical protein [unclassified Variovorax]PNG49887.1 hypothetical protein CHC06_05468 [Variovorax sp. B2]PNG50759.1 hypothetical protein CHC07_05373 [Variovorax sp. B4]VTU42164.1 hypothetical protein H6P1_00121 [Variovorax sp. PBL-H6]VTU44203.1 hypothetical protein SRS16P1_00781 [Variovorax sp. SRS16]VTU44284.1 hypothetical protein E5P1_00774 [Variovorax sp. PBL-E5]
MRRFFPLYSVYRQASSQTRFRPSLGSFLVVLDPPVLDALARQLEALHCVGLPTAQVEDLLQLVAALAEDDGLPIEDAAALLPPFAAAVDVARFSGPDDVALNVATLTLKRLGLSTQLQASGALSAHLH